MSCLLAVVLLGFIATYSAQTAPTACQQSKADIVFLLDASGSVGRANFQTQLDFVENFTGIYDIGPDNVQVSVVTFSSSPHNGFNLNTYHNKSALIDAIHRVSYLSGGTHTDSALLYTRTHNFLHQNGARYGVPKILVVLTDGQSINPIATETQAKVLHYSGVKVISVGIGSGVKEDELKAIATDDSHTFTVASFDALHNIGTEIQTAACTEEKVHKCDNKQADIVFILDASGSEGHSNFNRQLEFVSNFTEKFAIGPNQVQISLVTFSTHAHNEFFLNEYGNASAIQAAVKAVAYPGGTTHTDEALHFVKDNSFKPENGGRVGVSRLAIVMTDGNSHSQTDTAHAAAQLHNAGVKVISIGIGTSVSRTELAAIATDSSHVFTVSNFQALDSLESELQHAACSTSVQCGGSQADIVFILDSSSSEGRANFDKQLDFASNFVKQFDIGPSDVQVGLITFAYTARNEFYLNKYADKYDLLTGIQSVHYRSGSTHTDQGLRYARYYQFIAAHGARANASRVAIVLTDGRSHDISKTITEAHALKAKGVKVVTIGVGSSINQYELNSMATDRNHAFTVGSFDILHTIQQDIKDESCGNGVVRPTPNPECGSQPADIVFVLDSSSSEGRSNYQKQLDFVRDFAYQFKIGPHDVQVSVVSFSSSVHEQFPLNKYHDQAALLAAIAKITYNSGSTHTYEALSYVRQHSFVASKGARSNATHTVVVITDGKSTYPNRTLVEANALRNMAGTKVISIGIGLRVDHRELEHIASDHAHALAVANFDALDSMRSELTYVACQTCGFISKADIVFVLDASSSEGSTNFQKQLDFISGVSNDFQIGANHVQIGAITFSTNVNNEFYLNTYNSKSAVLSAIQKIAYLQGNTNTDKALTYVKDHAFTAQRGARADARNYAIVLTDGASTNRQRTSEAAQQLQKQNVVVMAIGIGANVNTPELKDIASDAKHVFTVRSFDALKTIREDIKAAACEEIITTTTSPAPTTGVTQTTN